MEVKEYIPKNIVLMELDYTEPEELEPEENEIPEEKVLEENSQSLKDLARDIADIRKRSNRNYSEAELEAELLKEIQDRNKQEVQKRKEEGKGFDKSKYTTNETEEEGKQNVTPAKTNQADGKVTVNCNVPNRKCYIRKKPTFKCKAGGKVYIDIKVDKIGRVKRATVNDLKSTTTNQCLLDNALEYAKNYTKVKADLKGGRSSSGYIIYNFIKQ